ncbi:conserved hypothetical protein [Trichormus variabilis ATCC 29413]|uniref:Uncharacterized protein n=2 Tax=Anabaena variabilis TaxID=264691 RepID=Q3MDR0_TRIV2|nr:MULTISPECIES: hypothetical protein [Nostocaceae]ABA20876.1 conserved hypothetical protein [Trichormus variabilis ATCC 29413]MBC1216713.1 hypothetical protein [Trichormus variabilis ARAD]MBC1257996.1 hypothetical protein [Trichormus variabilis V5]MBC1269665.1 hypothetical protein [Trichormus variabilis FSR]MBC1304961.1 hypothetical protein [Trichormus variabilis N2B]
MGSGKDSLQLAKTKTRLLLALWDLGGMQQEVKKGQLNKRILSKGKKAADYQGVFEELQEQGAIAISKQGYTLTSPKGLEVLGESLRSGEFKFEGTIVGTWAANALVKWISQIDVAVVNTSVPVNGKNAIASYEEFKSVVLEVYDKLNQNYNLNDLVPIYRIRREIGDRVSRENFHEWLLEVQANDIFQLIAGEIPDFTPDKREDSITIPGAELRSYAKRLS